MRFHLDHWRFCYLFLLFVLLIVFIKLNHIIFILSFIENHYIFIFIVSRFLNFPALIYCALVILGQLFFFSLIQIVQLRFHFTVILFKRIGIRFWAIILIVFIVVLIDTIFSIEILNVIDVKLFLGSLPFGSFIDIFHFILIIQRVPRSWFDLISFRWHIVDLLGWILKDWTFVYNSKVFQVL